MPRDPHRPTLSDPAQRVGGSRLSGWIKRGVSLAAKRTGARIAFTVAKRNPAGFIAATFVAAGLIGAGVLAYRAYRKYKPATADGGGDHVGNDTSARSSRLRAPIEGQSEVIARRPSSSRRSASKAGADTNPAKRQSGRGAGSRTDD